MKNIAFLFGIIVVLFIPLHVNANLYFNCPQSEEEVDEWINREITFKEIDNIKLSMEILLLLLLALSH